MWCIFDGLKEPPMIRISGELYVVKMSVMTWSKIASVRDVREYVFVVEVGWKSTLLWNVAIYTLGVSCIVSRLCSRVGQ